MKKLCLFFLVILILLSTSVAETRWQDSVIPSEKIIVSDICLKIDGDSIFAVGYDIPAGIYRITHGYIYDQELPPANYMFMITEDSLTIYKSDIRSTAENIVINLKDGQFLIIAAGEEVIFLSSVDEHVIEF